MRKVHHSIIKGIRGLALLLLGALWLAACNLPEATPTPITFPTSQLSTLLPSQAVTPTSMAMPTLQVTPQPYTPWPTNTPKPPSPTSTPITRPCNMAAPGDPIDITIPDGTVLKPGETFTKVWRLINAGTCTWTNQYALVWFSGPQLGAPQAVALSGDVPPGHAVDIAIDMVAPLEPGTYQSYWKLRDPSGVLFGIGPGAGAPFWVKIVVAPENTATPTATPTNAPTSTPTPQTQYTATVTLTLNDSLDVDGNDNSAVDVLYVAANNAHVLRPQNNATWGIYGNSQPSLADCEENPRSTADIPIDSLALNTYLCYQSSDGLYGYAQFTTLDNDTWQITLNILTWASP